MADKHAQDRVYMTHPKVHTNKDVAPAVTTRHAFEKVYKDKGWKLEETAQPVGTAVTVTSPEEVTGSKKS